MYSPEIPKSRSRAFGQAFGQAQGKGNIPQPQKEARSLPTRAQQHARPRSTRLVLRRLPDDLLEDMVRLGERGERA